MLGRWYRVRPESVYAAQTYTWVMRFGIDAEQPQVLVKVVQPAPTEEGTDSVAIAVAQASLKDFNVDEEAEDARLAEVGRMATTDLG